MRYAIFSDVHANETALRAMLADAADAHAEKFICLGDVLGYGPDPVAALELVHRKAHICLAGNHDDAACGRFPVDDFTEVAAAAIERHRKSLAPNALEWLTRLPHTCEIESGKCAFACSHGTFENPESFDYILDAQEAAASWNCRKEQLLFVGHTHKPGIFVLGSSGVPHELPPGDFVLENGKRYIVNVGSVGYPRSGECRSTYCVFDDETLAVYFRSFPFDLDGYRAKMNGVGIDEAPWVKARAEERAMPEVRGAESFGKKSATKAKRRTVVSSPVVIQPEATSKTRGNLSTAFFIGAVILAFAGIWCTVKLVEATPVKADLSDVKIAVAEEEPEAKPVDAAPAQVGSVVMRCRCTVPAVGRRIKFQVKMKRGGAPVWVHLRFENGNGEPAGDGIWYQNVKASKKSPKGGLLAPEGATAAFLEIVKAHEGDECSVQSLNLGPYKEEAKK